MVVAMYHDEGLLPLKIVVLCIIRVANGMRLQASNIT